MTEPLEYSTHQGFNILCPCLVESETEYDSNYIYIGDTTDQQCYEREESCSPDYEHLHQAVNQCKELVVKIAIRSFNERTLFVGYRFVIHKQDGRFFPVVTYLTLLPKDNKE